MEFVKLHPLLGVEIRHVNVAVPMTDSTFSMIRVAFEEHALLFRGQDIDDDAQVAFSRRFGPLQTTFSTLFAWQSNLDIATQEVIPPTFPCNRSGQRPPRMLIASRPRRQPSTSRRR